ncbi:hypothetical protein ABFO59_05720 [Acinetobacter radioresistens]|uniref:hypothetical protein n=1 Tax=Acinetobacter radioresistens TaxID=40216 RepID=UPI0032159071
MYQPQVERIPDFVVQQGKKDLSKEAVADIENLISRLRLVNSADKAKALNNIGILESYLNNSQKAVEAFQESLSFSFSEFVYSNYLQALELSGLYQLAIQEAISFLEKNPNNKKIYETAISLVTKYYIKDEIEKILLFSTYHDDEDSSKEAAEFRSMYVKDFMDIDKLGINSNYLNSIINLAFRQAKNIQKGQLDIKTCINDIDQLSIILNVYGIGFEDIKVLNKDFDNLLFKMIESKEIDSDVYFDHLLKFSIGFTIASEIAEAA